MANRDVRLRSFGFPAWDGPLIRIGDVDEWSVVRYIHVADCDPFVIRRSEWDMLPPKPFDKPHTVMLVEP